MRNNEQTDTTELGNPGPVSRGIRTVVKWITILGLVFIVAVNVWERM